MQDIKQDREWWHAAYIIPPPPQKLIINYAIPKHDSLAHYYMVDLTADEVELRGI